MRSGDRPILRSLLSAAALAWGLGAACWPAPAAAGACDPKLFGVAIDVGHTAGTPGSTSASGLPEFGFNLALAEDLAIVLKEAGFEKVTVMVSRSGGQAGLEARPRRAEADGAAVMVSIHHDSAQPQFLSETVLPDGRVSRHANQFRGYSVFVAPHGPRGSENLQLGEAIATALHGAGLPFTPHHAAPVAGEGRRLLDSATGLYARDNLAILRGARIPSVLVEAGVIVNETEEKLLLTDRRRRVISSAIRDGILSYCRTSGSRTSASPGRP